VFLELTDAFASGSGYLDDECVYCITVIPLKGKVYNRMVYVKRANDELSSCAKDFIEKMQAYFYNKKDENS
ncbi:LysR family transcriptional regulator, partial [Streptococcus suis]